MTTLSKDEISTMKFIANGLSNDQIGEKLGVSATVVKSCLESLYKKLGVSNRVLAVLVGIQQGIVEKSESEKNSH